MEDAQIVDLYWQRSGEAIPVTAERYGNYCAAVARNSLADDRDAEECVNDTWLAAWNSMPVTSLKASAALCSVCSGDDSSGWPSLSK